MARIVFHEHSAQNGACLSGAFADYVARIPVQGYQSLDQLWAALRTRPYEADLGPLYGQCVMSPCPVPREPSDAHDTRCEPMQRSRIWPDKMNCWEVTAHWAAGARRFLDDGWVVHIWDRDLANGVRHVWPSLSRGGEHLLVDLSTVDLAVYPAKGYSGAALPSNPPANGGDEWYEKILGGTHVAGKTILKGIGLGGLGGVLEDAERDHLPDWAQDAPPEEEPQEEPAPRRRRRTREDDERDGDETSDDPPVRRTRKMRLISSLSLGGNKS